MKENHHLGCRLNLNLQIFLNKILSIAICTIKTDIKKIFQSFTGFGKRKCSQTQRTESKSQTFLKTELERKYVLQKYCVVTYICSTFIIHSASVYNGLLFNELQLT